MLQLYKGARAFFLQKISLYYDKCFTTVELQEASHQFFHSQLSARKKKYNSDWQLEVKYKSTGTQFRRGVTSTIAKWISGHSGEGVAFTIKVKETYKMWQQEQVQQKVIKMPVQILSCEYKLVLLTQFSLIPQMAFFDKEAGSNQSVILYQFVLYTIRSTFLLL
ncbi:hypothetical protein P9112_008052 [Eukaryota sp. TZLM1-RC]